MKYFYTFSLLLMGTAVYAGTPITKEGDDNNEYSQAARLYIRPYFTSSALPEKIEWFDQDKLATSLFNTELPELTELDYAIISYPQEAVQYLLDIGIDLFTLKHNHRLSSSNKQKANFALVKAAQKKYCTVFLLCLKETCPNMPKEIRESLLEEYVQENNTQISTLMHPDDYLYYGKDESISPVTLPFSSLYPVPIDDID